MFTKFRPPAPLLILTDRAGPLETAGCERGPCRRGTRRSIGPETAPEKMTGRRAVNAHEYRMADCTFIFQCFQIRLVSAVGVQMVYRDVTKGRSRCGLLFVFLIVRIHHPQEPFVFQDMFPSYTYELRHEDTAHSKALLHLFKI